MHNVLAQSTNKSCICWCIKNTTYWQLQYIINAILVHFIPRFFMGSTLLIFLFFYVVLLCVFTFWFPCCDVQYDFRIKTMFSSSLPPVVCRRTHVLYVICVCLRLVVSNTYGVVILFCVSWVPYLASFPGLSIFYCSLDIL